MKYRLGLVLSGGGLRGAAHVGVIEALAEEGIVPDAVSGTSSGALVGALWAAGRSSEEMLDFFASRSPFRLSKLALGKPGLFDTEKVVPDFAEEFPDDRFEALERPLYVAATDLVRARLEIFASGELIRPLIASSSVPLIFTPTAVAGRLYVDGGLMNNLPLEPLEGQCDFLVGVYASPIRRLGAEDLGGTVAVSLRAFEVAMHATSKDKFPRLQVLISPPELADFPTFGTRPDRRIYEIGLEAGRRRAVEISKALRELEQ